MDKDCVCTLPVPGYLDQWAAGLVHDCPRVGGQRPAEEGGAQVHRHRGEPKHTERDQPREEWEGNSDLGGCSVWRNELPR